jgi:hypothetical protein
LPGTYTVTETVTDTDGQTAQATGQITILPPPAASLASFSSALGSTVLSTPRPGGSVSTALVLPAPASQILGTLQVAACGHRACTAAARRLTLGKLVKRNLSAGALVLTLKPTNRKLLAQTKAAMHKAHRRTLGATLTITIKLTTGKTVSIVQHLKLRP